MIDHERTGLDLAGPVRVDTRREVIDVESVILATILIGTAFGAVALSLFFITTMDQ